jgi:hypothetical protein
MVGMTHGYAGVALLKTDEPSCGWDYELIGVSSYVVAATIDLILKSRTIACLGDAVGESVLLSTTAYPATWILYEYQYHFRPRSYSYIGRHVHMTPEIEFEPI